MNYSFQLGDEDTADFHGFPDEMEEKKKSKCESSHSKSDRKSQSKSSHGSNSVKDKKVFN